jgi:hypothetical protein
MHVKHLLKGNVTDFQWNFISCTLLEDKSQQIAGFFWGNYYESIH